MRKKKDFLTRFGAHLDIPREALPGGFGCTLSGRGELTVRGCRKILSYTPTEISLSVGKCRLTVMGEGLLFSAFGAGAVSMTGKIDALQFSEVGA